MSSKETDWAQVDYLPELYGTFSFTLFFECAPPGHEKVDFALGRKEFLELKKAMGRANVDYLRQRTHAPEATTKED